jgi:DNA polymerase III delta prime subunit
MEPLASKIRPKTLDEFVGQEHLTGPGKPLRVAIEKKELFSFILWGPPGSGKTTLTRIYANALNAEFYELSAVDSGKDDIKKIIGDTKRPKLAIGNRKFYSSTKFIASIKRSKIFFCPSSSAATSPLWVPPPRILVLKLSLRFFRVRVSLY